MDFLSERFPDIPLPDLPATTRPAPGALGVDRTVDVTTDGVTAPDPLDPANDARH